MQRKIFITSKDLKKGVWFQHDCKALVCKFAAKIIALLATSNQCQWRPSRCPNNWTKPFIMFVLSILTPVFTGNVGCMRATIRCSAFWKHVSKGQKSKLCTKLACSYQSYLVSGCASHVGEVNACIHVWPFMSWARPEYFCFILRTRCVLAHLALHILKAPTPNHVRPQAIILLPTIRMVLSMHSNAARRSFLDVGNAMSIPRSFELLLGFSIIATLLFHPRASLQLHCLTLSPVAARMLAENIWSQVRHKCFDQRQETIKMRALE